MKAKALRGPAGQPQPPSLLQKPSPGVAGRQSQHLQTRAREGRLALWDNRISRSWWTHFIGTSPRFGCLHPTSCSHHFPLDLRGRFLLAVHSDAQLRANPSHSGMSLAVLLPMPRLAPQGHRVQKPKSPTDTSDSKGCISTNSTAGPRFTCTCHMAPSWKETVVSQTPMLCHGLLSDVPAQGHSRL